MRPAEHIANVMLNFHGYLIVLLVLLTSGCVPVAAFTEPTQIEVVEPASVQTQGNITCTFVVFRSDEDLEKKENYVSFDGRMVAVLRKGQYTKLIAEPGEHSVGMLAQTLGGRRLLFMPAIVWQDRIKRKPFICRAGETIFIRIEFLHESRFSWESIKKVTNHEGDPVEGMLYVKAGEG